MTREELIELTKSAKTVEDFQKINDELDKLPDDEGTLEDKYLSGLYEGMENLGYLAKPITFMTTPVLEAARAPFKYIAENVGENTSQTPPIDTGAEYESFKPSDRAGFANLLTDITNAAGIKTEPLLNLESEEFPKAAEMINKLSTPAQASAVALDVMSGPQLAKLPSPKMEVFSEITPDFIKKPLQGATDYVSKANMVKRYVKAASKNKDLYQKLAESGKIREVEDMVLNDTNKFVKPMGVSEVLDDIEGPIVKTSSIQEPIELDGFDTQTPYRPEEAGYRRDTAQGDLGKLAKQQSSIVEKVGDVPVSKIELNAAAKQILAQKGLDGPQINAAEKIIDDVIGVLQADPEKISILKKMEENNLTLDDIANEIAEESSGIVKTLSKERLREISKLDPIDETIVIPEERSILGEAGPVLSGGEEIPNPQWTAMYDEVIGNLDRIDQEIQMLRDGNLSDPKKYNRLSKLMKERERLEGFNAQNFDPSAPTLDAYKEMINERNMADVGFANKVRKRGNVYMDYVSPMESPLDASARQAAGSALESVGSKAVDIGIDSLDKMDSDLYNATNKDISNRIAYRDLLKKNRSQSSSGPNVPIGDMVRGVARQAVSMGDQYVMPYAHRAAEAMGRLGVMAGRGATNMSGVSLQSYLIPRNSEQIMQDQDIIAAKLNSELGPKAVKAFQESLRAPSSLPVFMKQIEQSAPHLFSPDKYGRIDGEIFDPILKQRALEQIINNEPSALEGAKKTQLLLNGNKYFGN